MINIFNSSQIAYWQKVKTTNGEQVLKLDILSDGIIKLLKFEFGYAVEYTNNWVSKILTLDQAKTLYNETIYEELS